MKRYIQLLMCMIFAASCAQNKTKNKFEKYMDAHANINGFGGTVLVTRNDSVLLKKAYGTANFEWDIKNTVDTKFSLASISKQFTAVAILQLAEKNKLSLEDKLIQHFPDYPNGEKITIKMLLTHNSGITDSEELHNSSSRVSQDSIVDFILTKPLLFEPGTQIAYSNIGYNLLSILVEKVSGQSFANYMRKNIFDKANMVNSGVSSNDSIVKKMAKPYYYGYPKQDKLMQSLFINWDYCQGLDGIYSTVEDMYLWNKNLIDDTTLLTEESKKKMFTSYNEQNYGYGVMINPWYSHGHNFIGHDGGYGGTITSFHRYTDDNVCVVVLSNNESPSHLLAFGLSAMALELPVDMPYEHTRVEIDPKIYTDYVGDYEGVKIHLKDNTLYYSDYDFELIPESKTKFFRSNDNDRTVEFIKDKKGETIQLVTSTAGVKQIRKKNM